jgi:mannosylglycoprotein endo-beta-mannosidase
LDLIVALLNFNIGSMPFNYLGVPIFKGKPKACHLQPIADKIKLKLSAWKASLLSIAGRVQLVKSVIQSMLTYSISIYSLLVSLLKDLEKCIRNFIWSGDLDKRKLVTVSWKKLCRPLSQGGLNIRSLTQLNEASNLRLCWCLLNSQATWAILLRDRVLKKGKAIRYHVFSSLWSGIKDEFAVINDNSVWLLGNGTQINFWVDHWCGDPLVEQLGIPVHLRSSLTSLVSDYILNGEWSIPSQLSIMFPNLYSIVSNVSIPMETSQDKFLRRHTDSGDLELKQAYVFKTLQSHELHWAKQIWQVDIPHQSHSWCGD